LAQAILAQGHNITASLSPVCCHQCSMSRYARMTASGAILLLDGEVGGGLRKRVPEKDETKLVPASVLLGDPSIVRDLHLEYIHAGAQVITTNTYATVKARLQNLLGQGGRWEEAMLTACEMAQQARSASGRDVLIAGSLPPLHGSFRPDKVGVTEDILPVYREHVALMAEHVDLFLCETMSTAREACVAATAARESGRPVWVAWNLRDCGHPCLRSGETLQEAWEAVAELRPEAVLVNCCAPETVTAAVPVLACLGAPLFGGYGNGFTSIPDGWTTETAGIRALGKRHDLTPEAYAAMVQLWTEAGARIVGGCCEVGVAHISLLRQRLAHWCTLPASLPYMEQPASDGKGDWLAENNASMSSTSSTDFLRLNTNSVSSSGDTACTLSSGSRIHRGLGAVAFKPCPQCSPEP